MIKIAFSLFLSGIFFGSGPCLASCGPILISYIAGTKKNIIKGLIVYIIFSLTRISVYLVLGLSVFFIGKLAIEGWLGNFSKYVLLIGGSFIILIGALTALGKNLELNICQFLYKNILEKDKKSIAVLGLVIGLLPCAPLLAILSYIGLISKTWLHSLFYSFSFGIGTFISPLILLSIAASLIPKFFKDKKVAFNRIFSAICGLIIIFLGAQLIMRAF